MIEQEMKDYISNHSNVWKRTPNVDKLTGDALEKKYNKTLNLVRGIENKISYGLPAEINLLLALYKNNKLATDMCNKVIDVCNSLIEKAKQQIEANKNEDIKQARKIAQEAIDNLNKLTGESHTL